MFQPHRGIGRYPCFLTFGWLREDGDLEIVATLNGETIEDDNTWNHLVEQTYLVIAYDRDDIQVFNREDVVSVLVLDPSDNLTLQEVSVGLD